MVNVKAQEMSIQTVVVVIMVLIVLVVVIAFAVPQLTGMFGGMAQLANSTQGNIDTNIDLKPKSCYAVNTATPGSAALATPAGCASLLGSCSNKHNEFDCRAVIGTAATDFCCKWTRVN